MKKLIFFIFVVCKLNLFGRQFERNALVILLLDNLFVIW